MMLAEPQWLLLLLVIPLALLLHMRRGRRVVVLYPAVARVRQSGKSVRQRLRWLPMVMRCASMALLAVAMARPREGIGEVRSQVDGVAMMAVLDRSGSMAEPMEIDGGQMTKLEVLKQAFREFVGGSDVVEAPRGGKRRGPELPGRPHDLIGVVQFSGIAETLSPLSTVHETLMKRADDIELAPTSGYEAGTAVGDALALAAARLKDAEKEIQAREDALRSARHDEDRGDDATGNTGADEFTIRSKIVILFTDGDENAGDIHAATAAKLCQDWGIKVYTIGIGGVARGGLLNLPASSYDERVLQQIAEATGGVYRRAEDATALREVYKEIDELEKTTVRSIEYTSYKELFGPLALAAGLVLAGEIALSVLVLGRPAP